MVALTVAAWLVVLAVGLLVALAVGFRSRGELFTAALGAALLTVTVSEKALLLVGWFRPVPLLLTLVGCLATTVATLRLLPGARERAAAGTALLRAPARWRGPLRAPLVWTVSAATATVCGFEAVLAVRLPPRDIDSLWYHLVSVAGWVRTGGLAAPIDHLSPVRAVGWTVVSDSYPRDTELVGAFLSVFTHDTSLVALTQLPFAVLLLLAVYALSRRLGAARGTAWCAACVVLLTPVVVAQLGMAYNDIARAAVPVAAWSVLLAACGPVARASGDGSPAPARLLVFAGALFGLGLGIKPANAYLLAAALPVALWLCRRRHPLRAGLLVAGPAALVGGFWYVLAWRAWGSPFWPLQLGPFQGPMTMYDLVDTYLPRAWRGAAPPVQVFLSWWDAFDAMDRPHWYVANTGLLGLGWLLVLFPAAVVLLARAVRVPRLRLAAFGVVLPLLLGTLATPGAWYARYTIPLVAAGAVAFAVLCGRPADEKSDAGGSDAAGSGAAGSGRRSGSRSRALHRAAVAVSATAVTVAACAGLVSGFRWSTYRTIEDPAQLDAVATARLAAAPSQDRARAGIWAGDAPVRALPDNAVIGFCDEDVPENWFPMLLIGPHYQRRLLDLGHCGSPAGAVARLGRQRVGYLYTTCSSRFGRRVDAAADLLTPVAPRNSTDCGLRLHVPAHAD
ncbi:hypothetical protein [Streptacidiphilus jiangxiensis]|uniref:Dolichyl-phosphate-mannose-protein mannosyltransferase n=1 Tax=Streptacidiphilus jiangxiensis TaxID=235985 RepID=A0A1H7NCB0_STRJI|nr:hypothetical protein [Streptacidiphilus jiangxiensis]SEL20547.1 hypothetical protein SAMN05414137_106290 [Streptacidiphilus jiangxiensis]